MIVITERGRVETLGPAVWKVQPRWKLTSPRSNGRAVDREALRLHRRGDRRFALVRNRQVAAEVLAVAAGVEGERTHVGGDRLERDPCGDGTVAGERPVILVGMRRRNAATRLLVQRLVVVQPDALRRRAARRRSAPDACRERTPRHARSAATGSSPAGTPCRRCCAPRSGRLWVLSAIVSRVISAP